MQSQATGDFSRGSIGKALLRLAIPMTLAQLINILYNVVDRMFIGRIGQDNLDALTGVGVCLPMITILMAFANLVGTGGAPLFSIERGRKNEKEAAALLGNSAMLLILFAVLLMAVCFVFKRPMLMALGASEATWPYANQYITIYLLGTLFVYFSLGLNNFINAQGFAKTGMCTIAIGAGINIFLDPVFIFGLHMGVRGAALATVISQFCAALWTVRFLTGKRAILRLEWRFVRLNKERTKLIVSVGLAGFTMSVTNSIVQMLCNASLQYYGGDLYVGIMTIINAVREIISLPLHGISEGAKPIISFNYGAELYERSKKAIRLMSTALVIYLAGAWAIVYAFPGLFIRMFGGSGATMTEGIHSMRLYFFGFIFMGFMTAGQASFNALGRAKNAVFFSIFRKVLIVVPLTLLLPRIGGLGTDGVFVAEPISNLIGGMTCFLTMYFIAYRKLGEKPAP